MIKYLPQVKLWYKPCLQWHGIDQDSKLNSFRLENQKCDTWEQAIERINWHFGYPARVIVYFSNAPSISFDRVYIDVFDED